MSTHSTLHELLQELTHPQVRDLAWVIGTPSLWTPQAEDPATSSLSLSLNLRSDQELIRHWDQLCFLDRHPEKLVTSLHEQASAYPRLRLGVYFEHLVTFWLTHLQNTQSVYREIQLYQERERGRDTLGALDLVTYTNPDPDIHHSSYWLHIELAVKFYLDRASEESTTSPLRPDQLTSLDHPRLDDYVGPNEKDSFGKKLRRLYHHQLPLSEHPVALERFAQMEIGPIDQRILWIKGRLFNWIGQRQTADQTQGSIPLSFWMRQGQLQSHWHLLNAHGPVIHALHLPKPKWLAPPARQVLTTAVSYTPSLLREAASLISGERGASLWFLQPDPDVIQQGYWLMIVPDDWCRRDL